MNEYVTCSHEIKYMPFSLKVYNKVWDKISNIMQKRFHSKPVYNENYLKTKI